MATGFTKNFVVKNGITTGSITLDAASGNIDGGNLALTSDLSVTGISNLGAIANVIITGGSNGQAIITDGNGNLSFANASSTSSPAPMPTYVAVGDDLTIAANYQGLFGYPITIDGTMTVDGILIDVNDNGNGGEGGGTATALNANIANVSISGGSSGYYLQTNGSGTLTWAAGGGGNGSPGGSTTQVQFNDAGSFAGNTGFTFNKTTGVFTSPYLAGNGNGLANIQGANVSGEVTWAAASNAVAVGNVIGLGNIATINKDGNGSNVFYGNGFFASASLIYSDSNTTTLLSSFGSNTITTTGNVSVGNISATNLGNLSSVNKDGNSSNILYGNGVFASAPITYSDSNVVSLLGSYGSNTITTTGNVSVGNIIGNGQALTAIAGANVTGEVNYAATANSVAGANVTGEVNYAATANSVAGANISGAVSYATTANSVAAANVSGQVANSLIAGTVYTGAQPNITSTGTLTSLSVTGNISTSEILSATGGATFAGNVAMTNNNITGLADPVNAQDAATKQYVDDVAQGLHVHDSCYVATTDTLATTSSGSTTYNNGASGVGATITTTGTYLLIDGGNVQTAGTRILVKNESNAAWNGVYTYTNTTTLTRATDFDTSAEAIGGDFLFITSGSTQADTGWVQTIDNPIIGTTDILFTQFSGAGTYQAGTGLTLTGSSFSVNASQSQITSTGTLTSLSVSGNANIGNIGTTGVFASILSATGNANVGNIGATLFVGTLATGEQPNITSTGTLTSLSVSGNANVGNIGTTGVFASTLSATGNANVGNIGATLFVGTLATGAQPNITSTGTLTTLSISGNANIGNIGTSGLITATGNLNAGNIITAGVVSATGDITGGNFIGNGSQLTGVATSARAIGYSLVFGG